MKKEGERYIKWLSELSKEDVKLVGGKGANLGEMYNSKMPVPQAFVISTLAYSEFLDETGLKEKIKEKLRNLNEEDTEKLENVAAEIRELILAEEIPKQIEKEILEAYENISIDKESLRGASGDALAILSKGFEMAFVAVRSSATAEDSSTTSFAGQNETFLNVKGKRNLLEAVKKCWASLFTARSIYYRIKNNLLGKDILIAVIIQVMLNSDKSGVIFSRDPISEKENVVIEAVFGLGEGIVSGKIKPDHYLVSRDMEILETQIADKKIALIRNSAGDTEQVSLTPERSQSQVLTNYEIKKLADYAIQLEEHYKLAQDIEFAIDSGVVYIVQTRPITTLGKTKAKKTEQPGKPILKGLGASPGIASGKVKIIHDLSELSKIKKGDILVTKMTNPDMVVTMQKSAAIITDEGGVTCFAEDTKILTNEGFMNIKDADDIVNSGKELVLLAYDSVNMIPIWKKIISAGKRKDKAIRISVSQKGKIEDNTLDLTPNHKMITFENRNLIKKQIHQLIEDKEMICLIDKLPNQMSLNIPKKAYVLGALLSDGYFRVIMHHTGNPRRGIIVFTQKDTNEKKQFVDTVRNYFSEVFGESFRNGRIKHSISNIRGRKIEGYALDYICSKLAPALELTKISQNLDKWILQLNEVSCLNFLAGLIDGDGCFYKNRLHIYINKENVLQGVVLACLNLGIFPQITKNRNIYHVQILEKIGDILFFTKRVGGAFNIKVMGNKLFSAKQIFGDIIDKVNWEGKIKTYINNNLLIDSRKIKERILGMCDKKIRNQLLKILDSGLRMQRAKKICDVGEMDVYNLEIGADNELDHNFIVFSKKYTPLLVSNSHASIVSREMGIAAVVGTGDATDILIDGQEVTVDGSEGKVYSGAGVLEEEKIEIKQAVQTQTKIKVIVDLPSFAERASKTGLREIGLTRIEGIIAESGKHPYLYLKENNVKDYEEVVYSGVSRISKYFDKLWIRTSDIRSDEYSDLPGSPAKEGNPMLGLHGIRDSLLHLKLLKAELKALHRVAEHGKKIGILLPQLINLEELEKVKELIEQEKMKVELGVMIETPAAVEIIEQLCEAGISFISFGTNDLTQYTLAIDRNNEDVQYLYDEMNPAVLSQLARVIKTCKKYGVETSICGQSASTKPMVEFLVKQGIDSISVNADKAYEISVFVKELEERGLRGSEQGGEVEEREVEQENEYVEPREERKGDKSITRPELTESKIEEQEEAKQIMKKIKQEKEEVEEAKEIMEELKEEFPVFETNIDIFQPAEEKREEEIKEAEETQERLREKKEEEKEEAEETMERLEEQGEAEEEEEIEEIMEKAEEEKQKYVKEAKHVEQDYERKADKTITTKSNNKHDKNKQGKYDIICSCCKKKAEVPFKPDGIRPVYCKECYKLGESGRQRSKQKSVERGEDRRLRDKQKSAVDEQGEEVEEHFFVEDGDEGDVVGKDSKAGLDIY